MTRIPLIISLFLLISMLSGCAAFKGPVTAKPVAYTPPAPTKPAPLIQAGAVNSFTITVTQKTAQDWAEICTDWRDQDDEEFEENYPNIYGEDFCKWSITGFTPQGMISFQNYLDRVLFYIEQLEARGTAFEKMLRFLTEEPTER